MARSWFKLLSFCSAASLILLAAATLASASGQAISPQQQIAGQDVPTYSVRVNLVRLLVSVRNSAGAIITNLNKTDFKVSDSGNTQDIAVFERNTSLPLSVAILIDTSGSTQIDLHYETQSVERFINSLIKAGNPEDVFALFSFNWRTILEADFSRQAGKAEHALHTLHGEGGTSLYDAVFLASESLMRREGRHVIIIVTDGGDTTSYKKYEDALAAAQRADAALYPIVVIPIAGDAGRNTGGEHALSTLAASTGGRTFNPSGFDQMDTAFSDILHELRTQYLIGFYPKETSTTPRLFHRVSVETLQPNLKVAARVGYYEP